MSISTSHLFNPEGFFSYASSAVREPSASEAALRSAISRAYYAVFLVARDRLFGTDAVGLTAQVKKIIIRDFQIRTGRKRSDLGIHETVIFAIRYKRKHITLSDQLDQLREARVNADYRMSGKCLSNVGKQSWLEYAEESMQLAALTLPLAKRLPSY
jgi:hypothetical protein